MVDRKGMVLLRSVLTVKEPSLTVMISLVQYPIIVLESSTASSGV